MIGTHVNNYEIVSLLGEGGMGTVYLALHPIMGRKAAVKVLKPSLAGDESLVARFFNEARAANAIRHPNIIDIIDVGLLPNGNIPYMLMEFLEGQSLATRLGNARQLPLAVAVDIACQTASALGAAHGKGIVHRDLKPDNLFLVPDETVSSGERLKVLDFGIAKLRDDMRGSSLKTRTGAIMGTAVYMSPEQCQGRVDEIDSRTDIYSLGIILYEMLCGSPPFVSEGLGDLIIMHVMREPPPPERLNPEIPPAISAAILRALAKDPAHRFQSMGEFQNALRSQPAVLGAPVHPAPAVARTSLLDESEQSSGWGPAPEPSGVPGTPPPGSIPPGFPSSPVPTAVDSWPKRDTRPKRDSRPGHEPRPKRDSRPGHKESTTTFRRSAGEVSDTEIPSAGRRGTKLAVLGAVGFAAIGVVTTVLLTRPSPRKDAPVGSAAPQPEPESTPVPTASPPELAKPLEYPAVPVHTAPAPENPAGVRPALPEEQASAQVTDTERPARGRGRARARAEQRPVEPRRPRVASDAPSVAGDRPVVAPPVVPAPVLPTSPAVTPTTIKREKF